jgi:hypothetical protein
MSDGKQSEGPERLEYAGFYVDGVVKLSAKVDWPDGTPVLVRADGIKPAALEQSLGKVIIAGFGLAGRWVADIFERHGVDYVVVENNPETIEAQRKLGCQVVQGDISDEATLRAAGIETASILALTIPDEEAVLKATRLARSIQPEIYIVARTTYSSAGIQASQLGADEVIKGEQVVARQFYEMLLRKVSGQPNPSAAGK